MLYATGVRGNLAKAFELTNTQVLRGAALPKSYTDLLGRKLFLALLTVQGLGAFALITLGVILSKNGVARNVIRPRIRQEITRAGLALLPMFFFVALALGFLVVGQTVSALAKVGAISYLELRINSDHPPTCPKDHLRDPPLTGVCSHVFRRR